MTASRWVLTGVIFAGVATGIAAPAAAQADLNGTYRYQSSSGKSHVWTFTSCGPGCANVANADRNWTGQARLNNGQWSMTVHDPAGLTCHDGSGDFPMTFAFTWDAATLSGNNVGTLINGAPCGNNPAGATSTNTFTLSKV